MSECHCCPNCGEEFLVDVWDWLWWHPVTMRYYCSDHCAYIGLRLTAGSM